MKKTIVLINDLLVCLSFYDILNRHFKTFNPEDKGINTLHISRSARSYSYKFFFDDIQASFGPSRQLKGITVSSNLFVCACILMASFFVLQTAPIMESHKKVISATLENNNNGKSNENSENNNNAEKKCHVSILQSIA